MKEVSIPNPQHLRFLDGFRAVAALVVILHHAYLQSWPVALYHVAKPSGPLGLAVNWLAAGKVAVPAFIVLSGFCLMLPVVRAGREIKPLQFFSRRCHRILPPYYAALALALLLDMTVLRSLTFTIYDTAYPITVTGVLSHLLLVQNFTYNPYQIAGPLWSIAVEFQIYLFFPLFVTIYKRWNIGVMLLVTSLFGYGSSIALGRVGLNNTFSYYVAIFGSGMAAAHFAFTLRGQAIRRGAQVCYASIPLIVIAGLTIHRMFGSNMQLSDTLMGLFVAALLYIATTQPAGALARSLSTPLLVWIGSFSYSIYLVHVPLQQLIWQYVAHAAGWTRPVAFAFMSTAGTLFIIALAYGFYMLFERPWIVTKAAASVEFPLTSPDGTLVVETASAQKTIQLV